MDYNALAKKTFRLSSDAVELLDDSMLQQHVADIYHAFCPELEQDICQEIAGKFIKIVQSSHSLQEVHEKYSEQIHKPYDLAAPMANARQGRAEDIGKKVADLVKDSHHPDLPILDYGCGAGRPAHEVYKKTQREIIAADVDNFLLDEVPDTVVFKRIHEGQKSLLPKVADASIGDGFMSYAMHHSNGGRGDKEAFKEMARVIAKGGRLHVFETGIAGDDGEFAFGDKESYLKAQFTDFVTSNFFRETPIPMPVPGNYQKPSRWIDMANKAGFTLEKMQHTKRDDLGEDCYQMTFSR